VLVIGLALVVGIAAAEQDKLILNARTRLKTSDSSGGFILLNKRLDWTPSETGVIICDMWDKHWCKGATERVAELAEPVNRFILEARKRGVLIIHAPSDTVEFYSDHPARKHARNAPAAADLPQGIEKWCKWIDPNEKRVYPIDQSDGGCDCLPRCKGGSPWSRQIDAIQIFEEDVITDSGVEVWNLFEQRGIKNVMLVGVHTNMCVLGRPFGLRNMARFGKNVVLVRDLTDTMYNSRMWPFANHFTGTDLIVEHIEKYVCPTIVSTALTDRSQFRFRQDNRARVVFIVAEDEYDADRTLPAFARELQLRYEFACDFALAASEDKHSGIVGMETLADADLAVLYVRRRVLPKEQMKYLRDYIESGKPLIGLRTASHAFSLRDKQMPEGLIDWPEFDTAILGGNYHGHHGNKADDEPRTYVWVKPGMESHGVLTGLPAGEIKVRSWLYKTSPLAGTTTVLMVGRVDDRQPHEPAAWTNSPPGGGRVFYTSLGHPDDFELPWFRRMLINAIHWALDKPVPKHLQELPPRPHVTQ